MRIGPLPSSALPSATLLLTRALPHDRLDVVAAEKLFGADGARTGVAFGAWDGETLVGVAAAAGRWVKLLAVDEPARRRGVGSALLAAVRVSAPPGAKLRLFDHPGNYLSPGLDLRYAAGHAFALARGFRAGADVDNLRAALADNPLVDPARAQALADRARSAGYEIRRATDTDRAPLLTFVEQAFAKVWAFEVARALDGPRRAVHVAFRDGQPVAFAAADGNNRGLGWFGPAGTAPAHRARGLGEALLIPCLLDVRDLPDGGVIAWVGPKPFYARACGAVDDRTFRSYEEPA